MRVGVIRSRPTAQEQCHHPTQPFKQEKLIQNKKYV
jgi:hypothetical protein